MERTVNVFNVDFFPSSKSTGCINDIPVGLFVNLVLYMTFGGANDDHLRPSLPHTRPPSWVIINGIRWDGVTDFSISCHPWPEKSPLSVVTSWALLSACAQAFRAN